MKGKKLIVPVMLASLVGAPVAVLNNAVASKAYAYDNTTAENKVSVVGPEIQLKSYKTKYKLGDAELSGGLKVPEVSNPNHYKLTKTAIYPDGTEVTLEEEQTAITLAGRGTYKFKYSLVDETGDKTISTNLFDEVCIFIEGDDYSLEMPTNSYHIVPKEMKYTEDRVVTFPVPNVYENDELADSLGGEVKLVVEKTGGNQVDDADIEYVAKDAQENTTGEAYYKVTFHSEGRYTYHYIYKVADEVVARTEGEKSFWLRTNSTAEDVTLDYSLLSDIKTSGGEVGTAISLPQVKVFAKGNSSKTYDAYTKIKVTYIGNETDDIVEVDLEEDGFSFVPKYTGDYQVEYQISIPNLGLSVTNPKKYTIKDVADTTSPVLYLTNSYTVGEDGKINDQDVADKTTEEIVRMIGDLSHNVESYYALSATDPNKVTVTIPAAYVSDNHTDRDEVTVTRVLYKRYNSSNTFKIVKTADGDEAQDDTTKVAYYTFGNGENQNGVGEYVVKYTVEDKNGNKKDYSYYIYIKANGDVEADWVPQINMDTTDNIPNSLKSDEKKTITFSKPEVNDKHNGVKYDSNLDVHTYYAYSAEEITKDNIAEKFDSLTKTELYLNENKQYELEYEGATTGVKYLYIITTAKNSYNSDKTAYAFKAVKIRSINPDDAPATISFGEGKVSIDVVQFKERLINANKKSNGGVLKDEDYTDFNIIGDNGLTGDSKALFKQGDKIILPAVTFTDNDENLSVGVYVTYLSNDGKTVNKVNVNSFNCKNWMSGTEYNTTISNASFIADYAKMYTITYVARDINNNVTSRSFAVYVNDTIAPVIKVENASAFAEKAEVWQEFKVPTAYVVDNGERDDSISVKWDVSTNDGYYERTDNGFTPKATGTYYITYTAVDDAGNESFNKQHSVEVVATDKSNPILKVVDGAKNYKTDYEWDSDKNYVYFAIPKVVDVNETVGGVVVDSPVVKHSSSSSEIEKISNPGLDGYSSDYYYFYKASKQGVYTATYTAKNKFNPDKSSTLAITINVGDCVAPEIEWVDEDNKVVSSVTEGDTWQFNMSMVNIFDEYDGDVEDENITITMTDPDGKTVDNGDDYKYTFDKVGSYTFKIVAKDKAGNSTYNDYSYTIVVNAKDSNVQNKNTVLGMSPALGTTLIVLSVVVLGGVIVYFVLSSNKARKVTNAKNKNKK